METRRDRSASRTDGTDRRGAVEHDDHIDPRGNRRLQRRKRLADTVDGVDDIGVGLPEDLHRDARFAVDKTGGANVFDRILDVGDIGQFDGCAVVISDDQRLVIIGFQKLVVRQDVGRRVAVPDLAFRHIRILLAQHIFYILKAEPITVQLRGIDVHANRRKRTPADVHLPYAGNLGQLLLHDRRGGIIERARDRRSWT